MTLNSNYRLNFIKLLPYDQKVQASKLIERGATKEALYFFCNLMNKNYSHLGASVIEKDLEYYCNKFPNFSIDFKQAFNQNKNHDYNNFI